MKKSFVILCACLLTACLPGMGDNSDSIQQQDTGQVGEIAHPTGGKEIWFALAALEGMPGYPVEGVAQSHYFQNGLYLHTTQANIAPAPEGYFYEAWLMDGATTISLGRLENGFGDTRHSVQFETSEDLRSLTTIFITREVDDGDSSLGEVIGQGILKDTPRQ